MKKRSLSGNVGIGIFIVGFVCVCVAFFEPAWLVSDTRLPGASLNRFGLWRHCFRSLPDPVMSDAAQRRFVGCRWIYDPFTAGYSKIREFLVPGFIIVTQIFFTLCFLSCVVGFGLVLFFGLCSDPEQKHHVNLTSVIGVLLLIGGISGIFGVTVFGFYGNSPGWMPGHETNYFGWCFGTAIVGSVLVLIASSLFIVEANIQRKKRNYLKESQTRFQLESRN